MAKFFPNLMKTMYPQILEKQNSSKLNTNHTKMHHNQINGKKKQRQNFKDSQTKIKQTHYIDKLVSRKKQILPLIIQEL